MKQVRGSSRLRAACVLVLLSTGVLGFSSAGAIGPVEPWGPSKDFEEEDKQPKVESEVVLPAFPKAEDFVEFYTGPTATNRYFIDTSSVSLVDDNVVRYVLLVQTAGGVKNISYEGMRCQTRERRLYATGREEGVWSKARRSEWLLIQNTSSYRHQAELFYSYFCRPGEVQPTVKQMVAALKAQRLSLERK